MKKAIMMPFITVLASASLLVIPLQGTAAVKDVQKQLDQVTQQEAANKKKQQEAEKNQANLKNQMNQLQESIDQIQTEINKTGKQLDELNKQVADLELKQKEKEVELAEAEKRVESREELLKSRVQLMYTSGSVSYLEVLVSAKSFGDFIERFQNLMTIVGKDQDILDSNKTDRDTIAANKAEIEKQKTEKKTLLAEREAQLLTQQKQEKQKEVAIAGLSKEYHKEEEISEDAEAAAVALVKQKQALYKKLEEEKRKEEAAKAAKAGQAAKPSQPKVVNAGSGKLMWPTSGIISSEFGYRIDPIKKVNKLHKGLDIAAPRGTPVVSADDGTVILAGWVSGYGNTVVVDHNNGLVTWYGHMSAISVKEGDSVKRGGKVGAVGSTGDSTGNHLHFEVHTDAGPVNPRGYLGG